MNILLILTHETHYHPRLRTLRYVAIKTPKDTKIDLLYLTTIIQSLQMLKSELRCYIRNEMECLPNRIRVEDLAICMISKPLGGISLFDLQYNSASALARKT
jgi:hypothetical protein